MSMTHGDFDDDYLERLALGSDHRPRFELLRFAGHFDSLMLGRRGHSRPGRESDLDPARRQFVERFRRLQAEHGVRFDLAHNMTVTPRNLGQVAEVVRRCLPMGYGMLSFQPAARVGNPARWREDYREATMDAVWAEIERGVGRRLPWAHLQMGDPRCNRAAYGVLTHSGDWVPLLEDGDPRDLRVRDRFLEHVGGMDFDRPRAELLIACLRLGARHPGLIPVGLGWALRLGRRLGWSRLRRGRLRGMTFVVHAFMDETVVRQAWEKMEAGEVPEDAEVAAAAERLGACSYAMAHPEDGRIVPACVQHALLDRVENARLIQQLG